MASASPPAAADLLPPIYPERRFRAPRRRHTRCGTDRRPSELPFPGIRDRSAGEGRSFPPRGNRCRARWRPAVLARLLAGRNASPARSRAEPARHLGRAPFHPAPRRPTIPPRQQLSSSRSWSCAQQCPFAVIGYSTPKLAKFFRFCLATDPNKAFAGRGRSGALR
jgi:hypothetical protein